MDWVRCVSIYLGINVCVLIQAYVIEYIFNFFFFKLTHTHTSLQATDSNSCKERGIFAVHLSSLFHSSFTGTL